MRHTHPGPASLRHGRSLGAGRRAQPIYRCGNDLLAGAVPGGRHGGRGHRRAHAPRSAPKRAASPPPNARLAAERERERSRSRSKRGCRPSTAAPRHASALRPQRRRRPRLPKTAAKKKAAAPERPRRTVTAAAPRKYADRQRLGRRWSAPRRPAVAGTSPTTSPSIRCAPGRPGCSSPGRPARTAARRSGRRTRCSAPGRSGRSPAPIEIAWFGHSGSHTSQLMHSSVISRAMVCACCALSRRRP